MNVLQAFDKEDLVFPTRTRIQGLSFLGFPRVLRLCLISSDDVCSNYLSRYHKHLHKSLNQ
jgi:hypothetical protein